MSEDELLKMSDDELLDALIAKAVRGGPSPFPTDKAYQWKGDFETTYAAGDKQMLLWAVDDYAQRGEPIPKWAADALHDIMFRGVARGKFESWDDAFGPIYVDQQRTIQPRRHMVAVWKRVRELRRKGHPIDDTLFENVSKEFAIGIGKVKEYYGDMQRFMERYGNDARN